MSGESVTGSDERRAHERMRVACLMSDATLMQQVERLLRLWVPEVEISTEATGAVREMPAVDVIVLDAPAPHEEALEPLRRVRASGYEGGVVVVVPEAVDAESRTSPPLPGPEAEWMRLGGTICPLGADAGERLATALTDAFAETLAHSTDDANAPASAAPRDRTRSHAELVAGLRRELWDTRRRLAIAEVALQLQHALNNPLAALLAEAQLLELEQLLPEHRTAVRRMVELCRRMSATLRALDVAHQAPVPPPQRTSAPVTRERGGGGDWFGRGA